MPPKTKKITFSSDDSKTEVVKGEGVFDVNLGNLTAKSAEMYKKKKDAKITSLELFRRPVENAITGAMDLFTNNAVSKFFKNTSHDQIFHLGLIVNGKFLYHKQENITIESLPKGFRKSKGIEFKPVSGFGDDLTFKDMYRRTREKIGEKKFYTYDAYKSNCQDFIVATLDTIGASYDKTWVKQDLEELVKASPEYFPGFAKALTDVASVAKKVTGGGHKRRGRPPKQAVAIQRPPERSVVKGEGVDIDAIVEKVLKRLEGKMKVKDVKKSFGFGSDVNLR